MSARRGAREVHGGRMTNPRALVFAAVLVVVAILARGGQLPGSPLSFADDANAQSAALLSWDDIVLGDAQNGLDPTDRQGITPDPLQADVYHTRLYRSQPASHPDGNPLATTSAQANPQIAELNGYCLRPASSTAIANEALGPDGFTATNATITTDSFDNGTDTTNDDLYCVVVTPNAPINENQARVTWNYTEGGVERSVVLIIALLRLELIGFDGQVGGQAVVCTVGWNTLLAGNAGNAPGIVPDPRGVAPNAVLLSDWVVTGATPVATAVSSSGTEWCVFLESPVESLDVSVRLRFDVINDPLIATIGDGNADDFFSSTQESLEVGPVLVDIVQTNFSELRHVRPDNNLNLAQRDDNNTVGAPHTACIVPSDADDVLDPRNISFLSTPPPDEPNVASLRVFNNPAPNTPGHIKGVAAGTICFTWTSAFPGEQAISLTYTSVGGAFPGPRFVLWDSNGDGNPDSNGRPTGPVNSALVKSWNRVTETHLTTSSNPFESRVTNAGFTVPVVFNVADGSYTFGADAITIYEWVFGSHVGGATSGIPHLLDGTILIARIEGTCGYFVNEGGDLNLGTRIAGASFGGRFDRVNLRDPAGNLLPTNDPRYEPYGDGPDDLRVSITNDTSCTISSAIRVVVEAYHPDPHGNFPETSPNDRLVHTETVEVRFEFLVNQKSPRIAWAGQIVTINYRFSFAGGCGAQNNVAHFVRSAGQPGNFLPGFGVDITEINGASHARVRLGDDCSATIRYESERPGEVDIEAALGAEGAITGQYSKIAFPIFYIAIEDLRMEVTEETNVSTISDVSAIVRGYFVGTNPSGREAETTPDGRHLPKDRWILPDDWERLRGDADHRTGWGSPTMPPMLVTFLIRNESVVNSYPAGVKHGGVGWFVEDGGDSFFNILPRTGQSSALGSTARPRILSDATDQGGVATVDFFGDFNLSYEECPANPATGNPHCRPGDVVGRTQFYAVADYFNIPGFSHSGQLPPVTAEQAETVFTWAGYKTVTVEEVAPSQRYIVARMKDRDGYCDAIAFNNALGVPVQFAIDAGDGIILEAQGQPAPIAFDRRSVTATSFDTQDDIGRQLNENIRRPVSASDGDECQAWIKISNSLPGPVNVQVTFPGTPVPPPARVHITGLQCFGEESVTVTNVDSKPVRLEGFALRSPNFAGGLWEPEHLGLTGLLLPGQSATFPGGPKAGTKGWITLAAGLNPGSSEDFVFDDVALERAELVWEDVVLSTARCPASAERQPEFSHIAELPTSLRSSGEGPITLDVIVNFGSTTQLATGWNLVSGGTQPIPITEATRGHEERLEGVYAWDGENQRWLRYFASGPAYVNTLHEFTPGTAYWVLVKQPFTLEVP